MKHLLPFIIFTIAAAFTPGPNNFMLMSSGMNFGIKKTIPHYLGIVAGMQIMIIMTGLGLGSILMHHPRAHEILIIISLAYILYLSWKIMRSTYQNQTPLSKPFSPLQAIFFQWVNPKAWMMAIGTISIFTAGSQQLWKVMLLICGILFIICLLSGGTWMIFGNYMQKILRNKKQRKIFNFAMAACLIVSMGLIFLE